MQYSQEPPVLKALFLKNGGLQTCNFIKEIATQVLSCDYYKIFRNIYFVKHSWLVLGVYYHVGGEVYQDPLDICTVFSINYFAFSEKVHKQALCLFIKYHFAFEISKKLTKFISWKELSIYFINSQKRGKHFVANFLFKFFIDFSIIILYQPDSMTSKFRVQKMIK